MATAPEIVDQTLLERLLVQAGESARLRQNHNFHDSATHPCQRLLNAILPGAYVQPHRHLDPNKAEALSILRGRLGIVYFDEKGSVTGKVVMEAGGPAVAVNIPAGQYHGVVALTPAVIMEAKAGPFVPYLPNEKAHFAPEEGSPAAAGYLARLVRLFDDD